MRAPVPSFSGYERAASLRAPDVAVNPPGLAPGSLVPPPVDRGYVITGEHLHHFEITGTPEAAAELAALVTRIGVAADGSPLDVTGYRVFTTPAIAAATAANELKGLVGRIEAAVTEDPAALVPLVEELLALVPRLVFESAHHSSLVFDLGGVVIDLVVDPGPLPNARSLVDAVVALVDAASEALRDGSLPFDADDDPESIANDVAHVLPVGTDAIDDTGLSDVFVLPNGVGVGEIGAVWEDGRLFVASVLSEAPIAPPADLIPHEDIEPQWDPQPIHCYSRKSNNTAWFDPCYQYASLAKDGDSSRVSWTHHQKGVGKSKGMWTLVSLSVGSWRAANSPEQRWQDWSPDQDSDVGNCKTDQLGIVVNGVGWSRSYTHCDEWNITKDNPEVDFKVEWDGRAWRKERFVASMKTASVANQQVPVNVARYDYEAW